MSGLSSHYAIALFELAIENQEQTMLYEAFDGVLHNLDASAFDYFTHPKLSKEVKHALIDDFKLPVLLSDFLKVLIDNNRFYLLKDIWDDYKKLLLEKDKIMTLIVTSKRALSTKQLDAIKASYAKRFSREVTIENQIDSNVVGGLKFEHDGMVLDETLNHALSKIKHHLIK